MLKKNLAAVLILAGALVVKGAGFAQQHSSRPATPTVTDQDIQLMRRISARRRSSSSPPTCN